MSFPVTEVDAGSSPVNLAKESSTEFATLRSVIANKYWLCVGATFYFSSTVI